MTIITSSQDLKDMQTADIKALESRKRTIIGLNILYKTLNSKGILTEACFNPFQPFNQSFLLNLGFFNGFDIHFNYNTYKESLF